MSATSSAPISNKRICCALDNLSHVRRQSAWPSQITKTACTFSAPAWLPSLWLVGLLPPWLFALWLVLAANLLLLVESFSDLRFLRFLDFIWIPLRMYLILLFQRPYIWKLIAPSFMYENTFLTNVFFSAIESLIYTVTLRFWHYKLNLSFANDQS